MEINPRIRPFQPQPRTKTGGSTKKELKPSSRAEEAIRRNSRIFTHPEREKTRMNRHDLEVHRTLFRDGLKPGQMNLFGIRIESWFALLYFFGKQPSPTPLIVTDDQRPDTIAWQRRYRYAQPGPLGPTGHDF